MSAPRNALAPAGRRRLLRALAVAAAVATGAVSPAVLPAAPAAADEPGGTTVVGRLVQAWAEAAPGQAADGQDGPISWVQPTEGDPVPVETEGVSGIPAGSTVAVTVGNPAPTTAGEGQDAPLPVLGADLIATAAATAPPSAPARLTNEVTVAMVAPAGSDPKGDGTSLDQVVSAVNGPVARFWSEQSDGAISLGVTATVDWTAATVDCSKPGLLWDDVAAQVHFVPGPGKHLLLHVSRDAGCAYALAEVGTQPSTGGRLYVSDTSASAIAHEFGHNFGLGHSSGQQCEAAVDAGTCRTVAYRDYYDVMGASWSQTGTLNAAQAALLKVLPEAQQQSLSVWDGTTTATLAPLSGRAGTRALRLTDADGVDYWLEYRAASGRDAWLASPANRFKLDAGVLVHRAGALPDTSVLLDGSPTGAGAWDGDYRSALPVGVPVPLSGGDFTVVVQSVSADGAVVNIAPTPPAGAATPRAAAPRAPSGTVLPGTAAPAAAAPAAAAGDSVAPAGPLHADGTARATPQLAPAAETTSHSGLLLAAGSALVAGTTLLLVRRLRRAAVRSR